ncbi:hypothetical protein FGO68_gene9955 [Halteria grandinella]|uniref:Uncharacterized protein n=1 Tax=Halteria grandinella TaxID=5974 RepID=A0A8J8T438_HALGN|nr:hypothetical protein FGO68_gene9955 [Halteria grandinella]
MPTGSLPPMPSIGIAIDQGLQSKQYRIRELMFCFNWDYSPFPQNLDFSQANSTILPFWLIAKFVFMHASPFLLPLFQSIYLATLSNTLQSYHQLIKIELPYYPASLKTCLTISQLSFGERY